MKATTKKIYSLASAIVLVVLALLLTVGALMPTFKVNMANTQTSDIFSRSSVTGGLICDGADVGVGSALTLVANARYVGIINKISFAEWGIRNVQKEIDELYEDYARVEGEESKKTTMNKINEVTDKKNKKLEELAKYKESISENEWKKLDELLKDEGFVDALYVEVCLISVVQSTIEASTGENYIYSTNYFDILVFFLGVVALAGLVITTVIYAVVCVLALVKAAICLASGYKSIDEAMLKKLYARSATGMVLLPLTFFMMAKIFFGSALAMGGGMVIALIAVTLLALLHTANRIVLVERRNPASIAKTVVTLVSAVLSLVLLTTVANLNLIEAYKNSNDANVEAAYQAKFDAVYAEELAKINNPSNYAQALENAKSTAKAAAKEYITNKLTANAAPLLLTSCLMALLVAVMAGTMLERLAGKEAKNKRTGVSKPYGAYYILAAVLLVGFIFTNTLGVKTVEDRNKAYFDENGGVEILFNAHELDGTTEKIGYETVTGMHTEILKQIEAKKTAAKSATGDAKALLEQEIDMLGRAANLCEQAADSVSVNHKGLIAKGIVLSVLLVLFELLFKLAPSLTDKYLPEGVKKLLAGNDEDEAAAKEPDAEEAAVEADAATEEVAEASAE